MQSRRVSRGNIPEAFIPFSDDGSDFVFYLDTGTMNADKECPVIVMGPGRDSVVVAPDFVTFVELFAADRLAY